MRDQPVLKLRVNVDKLKNTIVVIAQRKHLVNQGKERELASCLIKVRLYLEFCFKYSIWTFNLGSSNVGTFNTLHGVKQVFYQECFLNTIWKST